MRTSGVRVTTQLEMKELGALFQTATRGMFGAGKKVGAFFRTMSGYGDTKFEFFTPSSDSPFDALDDDQPAFSVGANIPKFSGTGGGTVTLHMYVWDRGGRREVLLASPHTLNTGHSANKAIERIVQEIQSRDPSLQLVEA
jgi:hypothetical protein